MPQRPQYPEAALKRDHYQSIATSLEKNRTAIQMKIATTRMAHLDAVTPHDATGPYVDTYLAKCKDFADLQNREIEDFTTFVSHLNDCIAAAYTQQSLWSGRIGLMKEY